MMIDDEFHVNRRNTLCGQINNVLCYFGKCQSTVKQKKLLFSYCFSLYGSVLWDFANRYIEAICRPTTWRTLPMIDELAKRSVQFMQRCLTSDSLIVCCYLRRFLSRVSILLLTRDIDIAILSVCPSVRLSVTRWYCMKTA